MIIVFLMVYYRYLEGNCSEKLISLDGLELDKDLPNYEEIVQNNRRRLLSEHFIDGNSEANRGGGTMKTLCNCSRKGCS